MSRYVIVNGKVRYYPNGAPVEAVAAKAESKKKTKKKGK